MSRFALAAVAVILVGVPCVAADAQDTTSGTSAPDWEAGGDASADVTDTAAASSDTASSDTASPDTASPDTASPDTASAAEAAPEDETVGGTADVGHDWLDDLSIRVFVDAYVASHWTLQNGFQGDHSAQLPQRVYDVAGGPAISLMALDISYAPQPIGATLGIRFGSGEPRWLGNFSGLPQGLQFLQQAFVSWRPVSQFQIDFGEFTTNYGGELAETWLNVTYTLGSLFQLVQPFYHGGFRGVWTPDPHVTFTALLVNGYNNLVDNNDGKTGGLQVTLNYEPVLISFGYLGGPEQSPGAGGADGRMRHLIDAVVNLQLGQLRIIANGDFRMEDWGTTPLGGGLVGGGSWATLFGPMQAGLPGTPQYQTLWGVSLGANYRVVPEFGIGGRFEYVGQPDISVQMGRDLVTGTFTLDWLPIQHLVIRLDNRIDWLSAPLFADHTGTGSMQFVASSILGVVVHSD